METVQRSLHHIYPELDDYERTAIRYYSGDGHEALNQFNRGENDNGRERFLKTCSKALSNAIIKREPKYEGVCHRGTKLTTEQINAYKKHLKAGSPVSEKHFLSTSHEKESAFNGNVHYQIVSKRGVMIEEVSRFNHEKEVLFDRNTKFMVKKVKEEDGMCWIEMEEV